MKKKKAKANIPTRPQKKLIQLRMDNDLYLLSKEEAERRELNFPQYVFQLLETDIDIHNRIFQYIYLENHTKVIVSENGAFEVISKRKIALNRDANFYRYRVSLSLRKIKKKFVGITFNDPEDALNNPELVKRIWDTLEIFLEGFPKTKTQTLLFSTSAVAEINFPNRITGTELNIEIHFKLKEYAWYTYLDNKNDVWKAHEHDRVAFDIDAPTRKFTLEVLLDKKLYTTDFAIGRLTDKIIRNSLSFGVKMIDEAEEIQPYNLFSIDNERYGIRTEKSDFQENNNDYYRIKFEVDRPILGVSYAISWIAPSKLSQVSK